MWNFLPDSPQRENKKEKPLKTWSTCKERSVCAKSLQLCLTLCDPMDVQVPLSTGFSRQEYLRGLPCPPPGDLPDSGIEPASPAASALQVDSLPLSHLGSPRHLGVILNSFSFLFTTWCHIESFEVLTPIFWVFAFSSLCISSSSASVFWIRATLIWLIQ